MTSVPAGTTVHDQATVTGQVGLPVPTGTVTFSWFTNGDCAGTRGGDVESVPAGRVGVVDATTFTQTPVAGGELRVPGHLLR